MTGDWFDHIDQNPHLLPAAVRQENESAAILDLLRERRLTERLPPEDLQRRQRTMLLAVTRHAGNFSPHFASRLRTAGLIPSAVVREGALTALPPLTRRQLVDAGDDLFCTYYPPTHGDVGRTITSGSTGEPVTVRRTSLCWREWIACTLREHLWHNRNFAGRLGVVRASIDTRLDTPDWGPPADYLFQTGQASALPPSSSVQEICQWLREFNPEHLLILPSVLAAVLAEFARTGDQPCRMGSIRTLSETVSTGLREETQRVLGLPIHDSYTSQECGVMATQCPQGSYHVSETILLEVLDAAGQSCQPGEVGRVVVTDLVNFATPLIRYEIGDYAEAGQPSCACGRSLPVIKRFLGRERNLVLLPNGNRHWPLVGFHLWRDVYPIRQFQFEQLDRTTILAHLSATGRPEHSQVARLTAIIQQALGHPFEIRYEWHETPLPRGPGGKFEEFRCHAQ